MKAASAACLALVTAVGMTLTPGLATAQLIPRGHAEIGRAEHRVRDADLVQAASGTLFGGGLGLVLGDRFELQAEARGGKLSADTPDSEDREIAEVQLLGGAHLRPWLTLQGGATVRSYSTPLARQRWAAVRLGAQAEVPLAPEGLRGVVRGYWMPIVAVSALPRPEVAFSGGVGVGWHGDRVALDALYTLERYDFPGSPATRRLEELSALQFRVVVRLSRPSTPGSGRADRRAHRPG